MSIMYVVPKQFGFQRTLCIIYPNICQLIQYVTYCRTIMGISCLHNFKQQVVGTRQQEHIIWRKENLHTDYVEQNIPYNLCNKIMTIVFRFFSSTFSENKKRNRRTKNRENRGKNIFSIECVLTQDNLFEEPTSIIQRRRLI